MADANNFAAALVLLFPFVFQKICSHDWRVAIGAAILCFGIVMAIFITSSRGGFMGLVTVVLLILWTFRAQRKKILAVVIACGLLALPFISDYQIERLFTIASATSEETRDSSAEGRIQFWRLAFQLFTEHPLTGVGPANFFYYSGYMIEGKPYGTPGHVTHSLWFEFLSEGGLLTFLPFIIMLIRFFRHSTKLVRQYRLENMHEMANYALVPMIGLGSFLVSATFLNRSVYEPIYWCIGLGVVHRYLSNEIVEKATKSTQRFQGQRDRHVNSVRGRLP